MPSSWCETLGIKPPRLEGLKNHPSANTYSLLLVALLERGRPMTLPEVALRFEEAGIAERAAALASLKKCKPARPPVYRNGEHYHLDPHDHELDQVLLDHPAHEIRGIHLVDPVAELAVEPIGVEEGQEELEILLWCSALRCSLHPGRIRSEQLGPTSTTGC